MYQERTIKKLDKRKYKENMIYINRRKICVWNANNYYICAYNRFKENSKYEAT